MNVVVAVKGDEETNMVALEQKNVEAKNVVKLVVDHHYLRTSETLDSTCVLLNTDVRDSPNNNLDELFMLMHFLDTGKFGSLEEFQEEFKDINREEQILRLHKMLAPHLLRRMKKDVMTELPPKKELILRVELCSKQKEYYKAILTRNYQILTRQGGAQISLINVVMELRKLCCHPYMLQGVQPDLNDAKESYKQLLESSGKLQLLDKMMVKLKEQGHRVLIYSQFQGMLDLLEDYCLYKHWQYERIDGKVGGAERQVMIYRLITRGTIEERMIQMTKKKMVLEHLVVGRLKAQNINQEELDDIVRYGSKELFADEKDELGKSRQIHYDDDAIDRLLARDQVEDEETALDGEDEDGFLKAFKVANFEYVEKVEPAEVVALKENQSSTTYWEELLRDTYEEHKVEELNALGKGKRNRNKWQGNGFSGLEDVSSDGKDDSFEVDLMDDDSNSTETTRRSHKRKACADSMEPHPIMEGEGRSLKVLGFNQSQRAAFVQILMRFGVGDFDWKEFTSRIKQKSYEEIQEYGKLFLSHIAEDINDSPTFTDGVPKEGLRIQDVLVRIAVLLLIRDKLAHLSPLKGACITSSVRMTITTTVLVKALDTKVCWRSCNIFSTQQHVVATITSVTVFVKFASENPQTRLFSDDILLRYAGLKGAKIWTEEHDLMLLHAVLKHGYGRWNDIVDDKDLKIQNVICQELNIPVTNILIQAQVGSKVQNSANMTKVEYGCNPSGENKSYIVADGTNMTSVQSNCIQSNKESGMSDIAAEGAHGSGDAGNQAQLYQNSSILHQFRDMQKKQVEFIKRRFLLLEKGLNAEYQKEYCRDLKANEVENEELKGEAKAKNVQNSTLGETDTQMIDQLPQVKPIGVEEISISAYDYDPNRFQLVCLYNEMCKTVEENTMDLVQTSLARENVIKNLHQLEIISADVNRILNQHAAAMPVLNSYNNSNTSSQTAFVVSGSLSSSQDTCKPKGVVMESEPKKESNQVHPCTSDV
ncbi:hypothetical protein VNO78_29140 [Psophocarpus tetragonolobus]|uniref:Uncharacterized protein n=1 Tax=Psophocarpus tetragonolobus TaxID=3891 RepID=A0AAN9X2S2_PSOTE